MDEDKKNDQQQDQEGQQDRNAEQWEKLTTSNKELKEKADRAEAAAEAAKAEAEKYKKLYDRPTNQIPNANQFSNLNQQQVDQTFRSMVDENGFLDGNKLMGVLQAMNTRAIQAEQRAQRAEEKADSSTKKLLEKEEKAAQQAVYKKYPQLDPDNKEQFDPKMWRAVYNALAVKAKAGENPTDKDYMDAADQVYSDFYEQKDMGKKQEEQKQEKVEQKQQINAVKPVSGIQHGYYAQDDEQELINKVKAGKRGALAELLNRRGQ